MNVLHHLEFISSVQGGNSSDLVELQSALGITTHGNDQSRLRMFCQLVLVMC